MAGSLILIANPGSASRKYALYAGEQLRAQLHFEWEHGRVICALNKDGERRSVDAAVSELSAAATRVLALLQHNGLLEISEEITHIGLRVVAPGSYFLEDRHADDDFITQLQAAQSLAPLHVAATLEELQLLRQQFSHVAIVAISDSAFHAAKPDYAWNYGISIEDADRFEIKRFGYHGLSAASVVRQLAAAKKLPPKLVVCHLGSGASVSAIHGGKSADNTMGYSPLEGLIMSTRSGSIDQTAARVLKTMHNFDDTALEEYLNNRSGLLGLGGSDDTRELLRREAHGDHRAELALQTYVYGVQKAIGQMAAAMGGIDMLVFTGTVGERSAVVRHRIADRLHYLDVQLDEKANGDCLAAPTLVRISKLAHSKPVFVVPASESQEMVHAVLKMQS